MWSPVCTDKLGVENGDIPDANFAASETQGQGHPSDARLNGGSGWLVPSGATSPWIEVDIGYVTSVSGLLTQGHGSSAYWITRLRVKTKATASYSLYMVNITQTEFMIILK